MLSVLIPANNEEDYLGPCLDSLAAQSDVAVPVEIIVAANACTDGTVALGQSFAGRFAARGWTLTVLDLEQGGKPNALNQADEAAAGAMRLYLDADIVLDPKLLGQLVEVLAADTAVYASGTLKVAPARSWITRRYADIWRRLPFMAETVPGAGLFAVNAAGRARWGPFPQIIADDGYVRLLFAPHERVQVDAPYLWPMVEGFQTLVRVRLRQDDGVREIEARYPELLKNEDKRPVRPADHLRLIAASPLGYAVYISVAIAVRLSRAAGRGGGWSRGR
ncbi:MAG: glycosyltransferase [Pseudomonadota bacterium]